MKLSSVLFILFTINQVIFAQNNINDDVISDSLLAVFNKSMLEWMSAYNGGDADKLIPLYAENAEYISSHVTGLVAKGRARLIENFQSGMNMGGHIDNIEILSIYQSGDLASLFCKYEATNNNQKAIGRNLLILRKFNNKWLIVIHMTVV